MDDATRVLGSIRENAMEWSLRTAAPGEAGEDTLRRAKLYADWIAELAPETGLPARLGLITGPQVH